MVPGRIDRRASVRKSIGRHEISSAFRGSALHAVGDSYMLLHALLQLNSVELRFQFAMRPSATMLLRLDPSASGSHPPINPCSLPSHEEGRNGQCSGCFVVDRNHGRLQRITSQDHDSHDLFEANGATGNLTRVRRGNYP
jgi:hypothetical protein